MIAPPLSPDEPLRLQALRDLNIVDTPLEERFERLTRVARQVLGVKVAAISLVESGRQWFKSIQGCNVAETSRDVSFCGHTILSLEPFVVPDARQDARFKDNPLVTGDPEIVFYAGFPIRLANGAAVGAFCVTDSVPRTLDSHQLQLLGDLAEMAARELSAARICHAQASVVRESLPGERALLVDAQSRVWSRAGIERCGGGIAEAADSAGTGWGLCSVTIRGLHGMRAALGPDEHDAVLAEAAKRLLSGIREIDALGRLGGEKFLIVFGPSSRDEVAIVADIARLQLTDKPIVSPQQSFKVHSDFEVTYFAAGQAVDLSAEILRLAKSPVAAGSC
jgi:GGDEF domain-containing protein